MSVAAKHSIYADLPSGISQSAVVALANALGVELLAIDKTLFRPFNGFALKLETLARARPDLSFIFDLGQLAKYGLNLIQLRDQIESPETRSRVFLCNSEGQVSISTRNLVKALGFAEIVADFDPRDALGGVKSLSEWICRQAPNARERLNRIPAFLKTVALNLAGEAPRAMVQKLTGHCAEILVADLANHIQIQDRSYHLKSYPVCILGNEACQYLQQKFRLLESQALSVGRALQDLGFIYHVAHEKNFENEALFYRISSSMAVDKLASLEVWNALQTELGIKDRSYLGKEYPKSFVGSEAISAVAKRWALSRTDAWIVLHRFERLGLLRHVTKDHGMIDGNFYYHFQ
jgi:Domain found in Dishevelled, Egl-10, and Pleckstrin (DEP)